ncbi:PAS domain S-box protein [candidate division KSB1 bacterium]|nr:PAS domain S-box protein [candidate division KSB1 bacterium]
MEGLLHSSIKRRKKLYDSYQHPVYVWEKSGDDFILIYFNAAAIEEFSRKKIVKLLGTKASQLQTSMPQIVSELARCASDGISSSKKIQIQHDMGDKSNHFVVAYRALTPNLIEVQSKNHSYIKGNSEAQIEAIFSSANMQSILDAITESMLVVDEEGAILMCNQAATAALGKDIHHLRELQQNGKTLNSPLLAMLKANWLTFETALVSKKSIRFSDQYNGKYFDVNMVPIKQPGKLKHFVVIHARDISESKRIVEALKASKNQYRVLYEKNPTMYFSVNSDGIVLSVNPFGAEQLGYASDELVGESVLKLVHPEDRNLQKHYLIECAANSGQLCHWEFRKIKRDSTVMWVRETARSVADNYGNSIILIVCEDITDFKNAQQELLRITKAVQSTSDAILLTDRTGIGIYQNDAFFKLLGYCEENMNTRICTSEIFAEETISRQMEDAIRQGVSWNGIIQVKHRNGHTLPVSLRSDAIFDEAGKIIGFVHLFSDISEQIHARKEKQKLEKRYSEAEKLITIGHLAAAIAHELNNPLDIILSKLFLLQKSFFKDNQNPECWEHIVKIKQQIFRLSHLAKDVLGYAKPWSIALKPIDINRLANQVIDSLSDALTGKITIEKHLASDLPCIDGDAFGLELVIKNLLVNSLESVGMEGKIIFVSKIVQNSFIELQIIDNGRGISVKDREQIFEPFFTNKTKIGGTGLGLFICNKIVKQHSGNIEVVSEVNKGTSVTIRLPFK